MCRAVSGVLNMARVQVRNGNDVKFENDGRGQKDGGAVCETSERIAAMAL